MPQDKPRQDKPQDRDKPRNKPRRVFNRAKRDVSLSQQPALNAIQRMIDQANQDYQNSLMGAQSAYGGFQQEIAPMAEQYTSQSQGIADALSQQLAGLSSGMNAPNLAEGELAAGQGLFGIQGAGGLEMLASQAQRNLGYQQSATREGALAERYAGQNLLQDLNDQLDQYYNRTLDVTDMTPALIRQREDELRQQRLENQLVKSQMSGDEAFNQYLQGLIGGYADSDNKPNDRNRPNDRNTAPQTYNQNRNKPRRRPADRVRGQR